MTNTSVFGGAERFTQYADTATPRTGASPVEEVTDDAVAESVAPEETSFKESEERESSPLRAFLTGGDETEADPLPAPEAEAAQESGPLSGTIVSGELIHADDAAVSPTSSRSAWKNFLAMFNLPGLSGPSKAELAQQAEAIERATTVIRQQTWTRAVNIAVVSGKGGDGRTPAALLVGGILADIRGGSTCVFEATTAAGSLALRAEGTPRRGLSELLNGATGVKSAGNLAGYTAPQTSHAAVIGTVSARPQLMPAHVESVRGVLDRYYQLTVTDTDTNLGSPASLAVQRSADAVIVPATYHALSVTKAVETVRHLARSAPHLFTATARSGGRTPVVVVLGHSGAPEDTRLAGAARDLLERELAGQARVIEAPYEPAFAGSDEFTLANVLPGTRAAWTQATAAVVSAIDDSHTPCFTTEKEN